MHIILDKTAASKLYKTLQQQNTPRNNKYHFRGISGIKPIKNTPENTSSNRVTTPWLVLLLLVLLLLKKQANDQINKGF